MYAHVFRRGGAKGRKHLSTLVPADGIKSVHFVSLCQLVQLALAASAVISTWACVFATTASAKLYGVTEYVPYLLYCNLAILVALPLNVLHRNCRLFFCQTAVRVLLPFQAVSWADFLLADM